MGLGLAAFIKMAARSEKCRISLEAVTKVAAVTPGSSYS
jgi:hypothetical protein